MKQKLILAIVKKLGISARRAILTAAIADLSDFAKREIIESLIAAYFPKNHLHGNPTKKPKQLTITG